MNYYDLTNSEIKHMIDEYIHSAQHRKIMYLKLVDGLTCEKIGEIVEMSPRHVQRLVVKYSNRLKRLKMS